MATMTEQRPANTLKQDANENPIPTPLPDPILQKAALSLTTLPPSIRNKIYTHTLDTEAVNAGQPNISYSHSLDSASGNLQFSASRPPFSVQTSLFGVNKQISTEALSYFYAKNLFVKLDVYTDETRHAATMLERSGLLFSTANVELVERAKQYALDVVVREKGSEKRRASVMFPAQYLPRLIHFLDQASQASGAWAPRHAISLKIVNTYSYAASRLQGDLLEPFRVLANLGSASISSANVLPGYADGLQANMTAAKFSADDLLGSMTKLADLGDAASDRAEYELAGEYGNSVFIGLTYGYLTHGEALHSQTEEFGKAMQRLRWRVELGYGIALSLLHRRGTGSRAWLGHATKENTRMARDLLLAEVSVSKALSLACDSPSPSSNPWFLSLPVELIPPNKHTWFTDLERAQTWYALGTVHAALGENLFAAGDFERSLELWGSSEGKDKVEEAFGKIRLAIDNDTQDMMSGKVRPGGGLKSAARLVRLEDSI